ncbi:MAG: hypothetical protein J6386_15270 [Candidatus Synoicihabitans palmerolidicus]|nr:hypothetical protein [Candidatus Synoicihabitans palmerolidicus]
MQSHHRRRHRLTWLVLGPLILLALILSYISRPEWPDDEPTPALHHGGHP